MFESIIYSETVLRFLINITGMTVLMFGLYYRRYQDRELVTAASLFNVFAFGVLSLLSTVEFSLAAGFGLFAVLALFTLRSEQISKIEIAYFFGTIAIAVICSVEGTSLYFICSIVFLVLLGAFIYDHPRLLSTTESLKITLDHIDANTLADPEAMCAHLSRKLGVEVLSYRISSMDYVNDLVRVKVFYRIPGMQGAVQWI